MDVSRYKYIARHEGVNYRTLYLPDVAVGLRISACRAAAEASMRSLLISRTACSTYGRIVVSYKSTIRKDNNVRGTLH